MAKVGTNIGLVNHAKKALSLKTVYMWGGILRLVEKQYETLLTIYGNQSGTGYTAERWNKLRQMFGKNIYGVDCVGLIKSYLWSGKTDGGTGSPYYGKSGYPPDIPAGSMYNAATEKGPISTLPEIPGIIVYCRTYPHVGVYIGNGEVIESTLSSRGDGVVKTKLSAFKWEHWFKCPYIDYVEDKATENTGAAFKTGDRVKIKSSAETYAGINTKIPAGYKGNAKTYTVSRVKEDRVLLNELYSWVFIKDITKV